MDGRQQCATCAGRVGESPGSHLHFALGGKVPNEDVTPHAARRRAAWIPLLWALCGLLPERAAAQAQPSRPAPEPPPRGSKAPPAPQDDPEALKAEALAVAARVAEDFPKDAFAHALLATVHYNHGNSAEALRCFDRCLQLDPTLADVCNLMGRVAHQKGDLDRAVTLYRQALRINPRMPDASYDLGRALLDLGRAEELIATMQEAIKACGRSTAHCYLLGQGYLLSKQYEKAKESLLAATEIDPSHIQAHFGLFTACSRLGQEEKAAEYLQKFSQLDAADKRAKSEGQMRERIRSGLPVVKETAARICTEVALLYRKRGHLIVAESLLRRAATIDPGNRGCRVALMTLYRTRDRPEDVAKVFEQLAEIQPGNGLNYCFLGTLHASLGQHGAAEEAFRRAVGLSPLQPDGYRCLAQVLLEAGRGVAEAKTLAAKLVELEPAAANYALLAVALVS